MKSLLTSCLLCLSSVIESQTPYLFNSRSYGPEEGLQVDGAINYLSYDNKGYIWICTTHGLYRFNGTLFKKFSAKRNSVLNLPGNNVRFFIQDKKDSYFFNADGTGLSTYNDSSGYFKPFELYNDTLKLNNSILQCPFFDKNNNLWIGVQRKGLLCINTTSHQYRFYNTSDPATGDNGFVSAAWINFITQLKNGDIIAGTNAGVIQLNPATGIIKRYFHAFKNLDHANGSIYEDEDGSWWMATWAQGLLHYYPAANKWEQYLIKPGNISGTQNILSSVMNKNRDELWVSSHYGLYIFNKKEKKFHPLSDFRDKTGQLASAENMDHPKNITGWVVVKDKSGNLWSYDDKKIYRIDLSGNLFPYTFVPFGKVENPGAFGFTQIFPGIDSTDQYLLTSYFGNGLYLYNKKTGESKVARGRNASLQPGHINFSVLTDKQLWLCAETGLFVFDIAQQTFIPLPSGKLEAVTKNRNVTAVAIKDSLIWAGADSLYKYNQLTKEVIPFSGKDTDKLPSLEIRQLFVDNNSNLWIALGAGNNVCCLQHKTGKLINYNLRPEISAGNGSGIAQSPDGTIFFASLDNGLYKIENPLTDKEKISLFTSADGLPSDRIHKVFCDTEGYLWLSTSNGLCVCDSKTMRFSNFNLYNNFPETDFYGIPYQLSNGNFLLAFKYGYTLIHRDSILKKPDQIIPVSIHRFAVNGKPFPQNIDYGAHLDFPYNQNNFSLDFSALCFDDAKGINYFYRIKGLNDDTVNISGSTNITLYAIPPGNYVLQIFVKERNRPMQPPGYELHFVIRPPFWKTWWFTSLLLLAVAIILYLMYHYRINQLMRLQKVRSNIAQDLHDDVGSTMTTISILSDVAKKRIEKNEKPFPILDEIGSHARELLEKLEDIVWSVNPKNDTLSQMVLRMKKQAIDLLGNKGIKVIFDLPEKMDALVLPMQKRRNVFLIYKEAVHNISKYADAQIVNVTITRSGKELYVRINDDGKGFDINETEPGNGLNNMQQRAAQCKGKCIIETETGKGTTVSFSIPV